MDVTYNFTAGTRAVAGQVNQNFADVKSAVDPLETAVANIESQLTSGIILPDGSVDFTRLQSYKSTSVNAASNATPIQITAVAHGFETGDKVYISGVGGNTAANGLFTITKVGVDTFTLDGSAGNGTYTSGGTCILYASADKNIPNKVYVDTKQLLNLGTVTTETTLTTGKITLADFSGAVNLVMPSDLPTGVEHTAIVNFTTTSTSSPTILQTTTTKTVTGATNASPIVITAVGHEYITGDKVVISGVVGNTNANGTWVITKLTDDTFSLNNSSGNAAYTSGGTVRKANFKWSGKNNGKSPTSYSTISGVRNILEFKTNDGGNTWEVEYNTFGGVETIFTRPNLTANGTLGGTSFAVALSSVAGYQYAYLMADASTSTYAQISTNTGDFIFYNPNALKVSSFDLTNISSSANYTPTVGNIYTSNDGTNWVYVMSFTNSTTVAGSIWSIIVSPELQSFNKYYKINVTSTSGGTQPAIANLGINAVYIAQ